MSKYVISTGMLLVLIMICTVNFASAQESGPPGLSVSFDVPVLNKYILRGMPLTDGPVIQPTLIVATGNLSAAVWSNMDLDDVNGLKNEFNEVDFFIDYTTALSGYSCTAGYSRFTFPHTQFDDYNELYVILVSDYTGGASLGLFQGVGDYKGLYVSAGYEASIPAGTTSIDISSALGWGTKKHSDLYYWGYTKSTMGDFSVGISTPIAVGNNVTLKPEAKFYSMVCSDLRNYVKDIIAIDADHFVFGITLSCSY
ncbi:hypothetical protein ACFL7D_01845 [candidate division KSB1 bacterium]